MTGTIEISSQLEEWGARAGYALTSASRAHDGRALFWSAGGEVRLFIELRSDGWFVITRSDRFGDESFKLSATSISTIEKYLVGSFGQSIRSDDHLPLIPMPNSSDEVRPGFSIEIRLFDEIERLALIGADGSLSAVSGGGKLTATASLVELSLYLTATTDDIMASLLDPDGNPLFHL